MIVFLDKRILWREYRKLMRWYKNGREVEVGKDEDRIGDGLKEGESTVFGVRVGGEGSYAENKNREGLSLGIQQKLGVFAQSTQSNPLDQLINLLAQNIQIIIMPRAKKQQTVYCIEHDFNLIPLRPDLYFKHNVYASFCSGKAIQVEKSRSKKIKMKEQKDESKSCLKCPVYNRDGNPGTNAFILADEQKDYLESFDDLLRDHNQKVNNFRLTLDQKSVLMIPKPKTKYSYCNVCRCNYEEYLIHIRSQPHKANVHKSVFTRYIKEYQLKYQKERNKTIAQKKPLYWNGQPTQPSLDDDVIEIKHSMPRKRVKVEMQAGYEAKQQRYDSIPQNPCPISGFPIKNYQQNMGYNLPVTFHCPPLYPLTSYQQLRYTQALSRNLINQQITQNIVSNYIQNMQAHNIMNHPQFYYPQFLNPQPNNFQQPFPNNAIDLNQTFNCHNQPKTSNQLIRKQKLNHPEIIDLDSSNED